MERTCTQGTPGGYNHSCNDTQLVSKYSHLYCDTTVTGIIQQRNALTEVGDFGFCAALVTLTQGQVIIHVNIWTAHPYTLKSVHPLPISLF